MDNTLGFFILELTSPTPGCLASAVRPLVEGRYRRLLCGRLAVGEELTRARRSTSRMWSSVVSLSSGHRRAEAKNCAHSCTSASSAGAAAVHRASSLTTRPVSLIWPFLPMRRSGPPDPRARPPHRVIQDGTRGPQPHTLGCSLEALLQGLLRVASGLLDQST